jgi:hypothetical protein
MLHNIVETRKKHKKEYDGEEELVLQKFLFIVQKINFPIKTSQMVQTIWCKCKICKLISEVPN